MTDSGDRLVTAATKRGVPRDQLQNFLERAYVPTKKQLEFHAACRLADDENGPSKIGFGGRRGPGKSHAAFAQAVLDDCVRFPGLKVLYLRKVGKAAKESFEDLRLSVLPALKHTYLSHRGLLRLPNGSRVITGHFNAEKDIDAYLGVEYDEIVIEEANTLTSHKLAMLLGSLRSSKPGWRPRAYFTFNPGGIGHMHIKRLFVEPWRTDQENDTRFVPAGVYDNPFVEKSYRTYLESLSGWLRAAWLDGSWDIAAGQFFTNWDERIHVIQKMDVPLDWTFWGALDYGFVHMTVFHLFAMDGEGITYVLDEYAARRQLVPQNAKAIKDILTAHNIGLGSLDMIVAGSDVFAKRGTTYDTIADQYAEAGMILQSANTDRINGAAKIMMKLGDKAYGKEPAVFVHEKCKRLIETLPIMEHNPNNLEDVLKVDVDDNGFGGDDAYDCFRYGLMATPARKTSFAISY